MELSGLDIIDLRKKFNFSQEKLAELIGVSLRTVQNYEAGKKIPQSKYAILHKLINEISNTNNPNNNSGNMENRLVNLLREMLKEKDDEIIRLRLQKETLEEELKKLGKQDESSGPGDRDQRRNTG